eukprot:3859501-Pyramimonas_sp.AAC.1
MHRPVAGLGFGPARRLYIRERRTLYRPYTGSALGICTACPQACDRPAHRLCIGCSPRVRVYSRAVLRQSRGLCTPVHRP